jgi:hypothetical protein
MKQKGKRKALLLTIQALLEREDCSLDDIAEAMITSGYDVARPAHKKVTSQNHSKRNRIDPRLTSGSQDEAPPTGDSAPPPSGGVGGPATRPASSSPQSALCQTLSSRGERHYRLLNLAYEEHEEPNKKDAVTPATRCRCHRAFRSGFWPIASPAVWK